MPASSDCAAIFPMEAGAVLGPMEVWNGAFTS
jgi:hypothetical protein